MLLELLLPEILSSSGSLILTLIDPRNTAIPSGKLCKLMPIANIKIMKSLEKHLFQDKH